MAECILIENIPKKYEEWVKEAEADRKSRGLDYSTPVLEEIWTNHMVKNDETGIMKYIADRGIDAAIMYNGSKDSKAIRILGVTSKNENEVTVATTNGTYTFKDGNVKSEPTTNGTTVVMPVMENILKNKDMVSGMNLSPFMALSQSANKYASYMLIGAAEKSSSKLKPYIIKAHKAAKAKYNLYNDTVNLVTEKFGDIELLNKLKATLYLTGDINREQWNKAINLGWESSRRTQQILDEELPKLDKMIMKELKNPKDRELLNMVFGTSGFANFMTNKEAMAVILNEGTFEDLKTAVGMDPKKLEKAKKLKSYMVDREVTDNTQNAGGDNQLAQMAAVLALEGKGWEMVEYLRDSRPELFVELVRVAGMVRSTHEVVQGIRIENAIGSSSGKVYNGYDEHGLMDVHEGTFTYEYVTKEEMNNKMKDPRWKVVRHPEGEVLGIIQRRSTGTFEEGVLGINKNRIKNGIGVDREYAESMIAKHGNDWLNKNNIVYDTDNGYPNYRIILTKKEFNATKGMNNIAHSFYRTLAHNKEVIESDKVKDITVEFLTANEGLGSIENRIKSNKERSRERRREIKPFLNTELSYEELQKKYPEVAKMYTPIKNISNYGALDKKVRYVRKDMEDMAVGYYNGSIFKDEYYNMQRIESVYKDLLKMLKIKMVVANPAKLAMDTVSNTTLLLTTDVGINEIAKGYPEALKLSAEMGELEGLLVKAKLELAKDEMEGKDTKRKEKTVAMLLSKIENHPFNYAIKNGFLQSQGTSMLIKEMDTISGLQQNIDEVVGYVMKDKEGNPTAVHNAIVKWMNAGFGLNDILDSVSNMSKIKGTSFSKELIGISERLKDKKETEDTVRYVSEFIAAPSSELVRQGSRAMQMGDIMARWTLYLHELKKGLDEEGVKYVDGTGKEFFGSIKKLRNNGKLSDKVWNKVESKAALTALDTFIDYRVNLPKEIKQLSDYGIIMFPAFWMRAQRIIWNMIKYHPLNSGAGVVMSDMLNLNGASLIDANLLTKAQQGTLLQPGQDVLDLKTILLGF